MIHYFRPTNRTNHLNVGSRWMMYERERQNRFLDYEHTKKSFRYKNWKSFRFLLLAIVFCVSRERKREKAERYFLLTPVLKVDREIEREKDIFIRNKRKEKKRERESQREVHTLTGRRRPRDFFQNLLYAQTAKERRRNEEKERSKTAPASFFFTFSPDCGINSHVCVSGKEFELCPRERTREKVAKVDWYIEKKRIIYWRRRDSSARRILGMVMKRSHPPID